MQYRCDLAERDREVVQRQTFVLSPFTREALNVCLGL